MNFPKPLPGLVISYSYLWHHEHQRGFDEGSKNRPCAIVVATGTGSGAQVTVLGITHTPPLAAGDAIEIPTTVKKRLGLDNQPSWIVTTETNVFTWPGPDLRPRDPSDQATVAYGFLPADILTELRRRLDRHAGAGHIKVIPRTE